MASPVPNPEAGIWRGRFLTDHHSLMLLNSAEQLRHASAQILQCSMCECFSHSTAQALQISAQSLQICFANSLPPAMAPIAKVQMAAQSWANLMQRANILISCSFKHSLAQCLHSIAHTEQAVIQL
jgi:hypothetical protein